MNLNNLTKSQLMEKVEGLEASIKEMEVQGIGGESAEARKPESGGGAKARHGYLSDPERVESEPEENLNILTALFDLIPHQMFVKDLEGRYLMVNAAFTARTGLTEDMARGQTADALTILDEPSRRIYRDQDQEVLSTGERREYPVVRVRYQDGREVINRVIRMPLMSAGNKPVGLAGIVEDITERIQGDEALRRSEQIMAKAESVMHVGSMDWDLVNNRQYWSDEVFRIIGHQPQSFIPDDQHFADVLHPEDKKRILEEIARAIQEHQAYATEIRVVRPDGSVRHVSAQGEITWDDTGKPLRMFGTVQDLTEKKQVEEELHESEQRFRDLIEGSIQGILIHRRGQPLFVNQAYADMFGFDSPEQFMELKSIDELLHPEDKNRLVSYQQKRLRGEEVPTHYTFRAFRGDGSMIWLDSIATRVEWEGEPASQSVNIDITERMAAETALRESEERFRSIVDHSPSAILLKDLEGRYVLMNKQFQAWYGIKPEDAIGKRTNEIYPEETSRPYLEMEQAVLETGEVQEREMDSPFADGTVHRVLITKFPVIAPDGKMTGIGTFHTDVSALRQAERMLMQAQRLEALGTLAGGIAHDLNNILVPIMGYAQVLLRQYDLGSEVNSFLDIISNSSLRAKDLVSQILLFTRSTEGRRDICLLSPIVKEVTKLIRSSLPSTIAIHADISTSAAAVTADPSQIHQVLMNLCINAGQAMPSGGDLRLELKNVELNGLRSYVGDSLKGDYVMLACTDTGTGMSPETLGRIFEPFFTTKEKGEGTGLGLSTVFGIVRNHEGGIIVNSRPGHGTRFEIYLPAIDLDLDDDQPKSTDIPTGSESILFVDDEEIISDMAKVALEKQGYRVTTQNDSNQALKLFEQDPEAFDLIITDQSMPGLTGDLLIEKVKRIRPGIPIILCTGFSEQVTPEEARKIGVRQYLNKPVEMEDLWRIVRQTLDNPEAPPHSKD
ncbi:MAG: PAS domain S-box protein [bacterium]